MVELKDVFKLNNTDTVAETFGTPAKIISTIVPNIFVFAGIIFFFLLLLGGFSIITSNGDPKNTEKGMQQITGAVVGFIIIITSFWLIQIVEIVTGLKILNSGL